MVLNNVRTSSQSSASGSSRRMLRSSNSISSKLQLLLDIAVTEALLFLLIELKGINDLSVYYYPAVIVPILMSLIYSSGVYRSYSSHAARCMAVAWAWFKVMGIMVICAFVAKISGEYSRQVIILWFFGGGIAQVLTQIATSRMIRAYRKSHGEVTPSLIVGHGMVAKHLVENINNNPWVPYRFVGFIRDDDEAAKELPADWLPCLGDLADVRKIVEEHAIRRVYLALPMKTSHQIRDLQMELLVLNVDIIWAPDIYGLHMINPSVQEVAGVPLYCLSESPLQGSPRISKLLMDKVLAVIALVLLSPALVAAAIAVKLSSPGPVFFRQKRHGLDGKVIRVFKFRSMVMHEETDGKVKQATRDDPRITTVGRFLRRSSMDELPQLFNVLMGEMSLVGPRPHAMEHNQFYSDKIDVYMSRHRILPGMTGLAQVNGCRGETETLEKMEKRVDYDLAYINNWSVWMDICIMVKTVFVIFSKNAY